MSRKESTAAAQRGSRDIPAAITEILRGLSIDMQQFCEWLGPRLAEIRAELAYQQSQPSRAEKRKTFEELSSHIASLRHLLGVGGAVSERNALRAAAHQRGSNFVTLMQRLRADLKELEEVTDIAERTFAPEAATGGRPSMAARDAFLTELVRELRPAAGSDDNACDLAERIAIACQIPVPSRESIARMLRGAG